MFAYLTGWRKSECSSLIWDMVNFEQSVLLLPDSKNGEPRMLPLVGELESLISRRWHGRQGEYIFWRRDGLPIKDFRDVWHTACRLAGLGHRLFHDLRRSAVKNAIGQGLSEYLTMKLLGHKSRAMLNRYHILIADDLRAGMECMLSHFRPDIQAEISMEVSSLPPGANAPWR